jgi:DNA-binding PadR family transcriptional regulator
VYVEASIKPRKVNKPPRKVYQYNKANTEELKEKLRSIDIGSFYMDVVSFS